VFRGAGDTPASLVLGVQGFVLEVKGFVFRDAGDAPASLVASDTAAIVLPMGGGGGGDEHDVEGGGGQNCLCGD